MDYCVYIDTELDEYEDKRRPELTVHSAVTACRATLPGRYMNHTDYEFVRENPIAFSIETKRQGEGGEKGVEQLAVWQSAHWKFLRDHIVSRGSKLPDLIPALLVDGNDWQFILTTPDGLRTKIWVGIVDFSTSSEEGVFVLVYALQVLRAWAQDEYWRWLRGVIFDKVVESGPVETASSTLGTETGGVSEG